MVVYNENLELDSQKEFDKKRNNTNNIHTIANSRQTTLQSQQINQ